MIQAKIGDTIEVTFYQGKEGPQVREIINGKKAYLSTSSYHNSEAVRPGDRWQVTVYGENPGKTVYFLRVEHLLKSEDGGEFLLNQYSAEYWDSLRKASTQVREAENQFGTNHHSTLAALVEVLGNYLPSQYADELKEKAELIYTQCLRPNLPDSDVESYYSIAHWLEKEKRFAEAKHYYLAVHFAHQRELLKLDEKSLEHLVHFLAQSYIDIKAWSTAIGWLKVLDTRESRAKLAKCYQESGDYLKACQIYETLVQEYAADAEWQE